MSEGNSAASSPKRATKKAASGTRKRTTAGSKHPKYETLIREAIKAVQKPAKGASRLSITKYVIEKHGKTLGLQSRILVNLKLALKRLSASGTLIQSKPGWYRVSPAAREAEKKKAAAKNKKAAPKKKATKKAKKATKKAGAKKAKKAAGAKKKAATKKAAGAKKSGAKKAGAKKASGTKKAASKRSSVKKGAATKGTSKRAAKANTARKGARKTKVAAKRASPAAAAASA